MRRGLLHDARNYCSSSRISRILIAAVAIGVPGPVELVVILRRDHAADDDDDVLAAQFLKLADDLRHKGKVPGGEGRNAHHVHVVLDGLACGLLRGLEQRSHIDVEADVGVTGGDHLGAAVVAVLAELGDHHARLAALLLGEAGAQLLGVLE